MLGNTYGKLFFLGVLRVGGKNLNSIYVRECCALVKSPQGLNSTTCPPVRMKCGRLCARVQLYCALTSARSGLLRTPGANEADL